MDPRLLQKLKQRETEGTLRKLEALPPGTIDFCSNDYLGLSKTPVKLQHSGGTGSRLISGTTPSVILAEQKIATFFGAESSLMFNSGYDANLGFFSCVPQRGDTILFDALIHASIRDGVRLSFAAAHAFRHNDLNDLEQHLKKAKGSIYVAVESLYSMDGDFAPLKEIVSLCERYNAWLMVDEAHAAGVFGQTGRGLAAKLESPNLLARLITFGKAYGSHGACLLGSEILIHYLYNFARSFIYTTALPEEVYVHNASVVELPTIPEKQQRLVANVQHFRSLAASLPLRSESNSPIQIVEVGNQNKLRMVAKSCQVAGLYVKAIFSPTVPAGKECIRLCLHSFNTEDEILHLVSILENALHTN